MKILHYIADRSGIFMYRCYFPGFTIQDNTEHNVLYSRSCHLGDRNNLADINWADLIIFNRQYTPAIYEVAKYARMLGKKTIFEIDDNWMKLNDDNPFAKGIRGNEKTMAGMKAMCQQVDAITVSTEPLKKAMLEYTGNERIYVLENHISKFYFDYHTVPQARQANRVNLLWAGAMNHLYSIRVLKEPLKIIMDKYDNVDFYMVGSNYVDEFPFMKKDHMCYIPWTSIEGYPSAFTHGDIALAPIAQDEGFYECKSNIRIQEASYYGMPVVASNLYEYGKTITPYETGFLANNSNDWVKYLSALIEDETMRLEMGSNAKAWAESMTIEKNYQKYVDTYERIISDGK